MYFYFLSLNISLLYSNNIGYNKSLEEYDIYEDV